MSNKSVENLWSISKYKADNNVPWTKTEHMLLVKELQKLIGYMRRERENKLKEKFESIETVPETPAPPQSAT